jgi:phosphomannomutase
MNPKLTVSGYRGVYGDTLTEKIAENYISAFASVLKSRNCKKILVGRDARESGPALLETAVDTLLHMGLDVIDLGLIPTPTVLFLIQNGYADGGVIITASHNPIEYNGLKFITETGLFTNEEDVKQIQNLLSEQSDPSAVKGVRVDGSNLFDKHLEKILARVNVPSIRAKKFKVALDPINSVGCTTTPKLFDALGVSYTAINNEPTGKFAHTPEPLPKNLIGLQALTKESKSDIGFAQDPDGDRLVLCDETGTLLSEELTLALSVKAVLSKTPGDVVVNLSTSNMSEDIASSYGCKTHRSKVGEANVVGEIKKRNAVIGGEGSGGAIFPAINTARDGYVGIALILELMAQENKKLSEIVAQLPSYTMLKEKVSFSGDLQGLYAKIQTEFASGTANTLDGLRLDFEDRSWVHIRPSNTEPVVRIILEAQTPEKASDLMQKCLAIASSNTP